MQIHILLVDDDLDDMFIFKEAALMLSENIKCSYAPGPEAAGNILKNIYPQLIVLDYEMSGSTGLEYLDTLKNDTNTVDVPVVLWSGNMTDTICEKALSAGAIYCVKKTDELEKLSRSLEIVLHQLKTLSLQE